MLAIFDLLSIPDLFMKASPAVLNHRRRKV
jgi:hypothetical protein